mgnify:CR=1 FL=1
MKQTERIHHRCRCLDRNFTFEEWSKYLRENPSGGAVLTVESFQFNICDVCLTPNHPVRIERNICELDIETAQSVNGRWCYGIHLGLHSESSSHGAQFVDDHSRGYPTEKEAIYDALLYSEERTKKKIKELEQRGDTPDDYDDEESGRQPKASAVLSSLRAFLKEIQKQKEYHDPRQLSLFDL